MQTCVIAFLLLGLSTTLPAQSNLSFELKRDTSSADSAQTLAQGDFNADGKPDIVLGGGASSSDVVLRLGNGDGTFQPPAPVGAVSGSNIVDLAAADLNQDGKLDVIALTIEGTISVFYGNGNGTFQPPLSIATAAAPTTLAVGNFNGDGYLSIAVGDLNGGVEIFTNTGGSSFALTTTIDLATQSSRGILRVRAGDIYDNGVVDLAVLTYSSAYVLWGDGHGNFKPIQLAAYTAPTDLNIGDLNQDGRADILVTYNCSGNPSSPCLGTDVFYGELNDLTSRAVAITANGVNPAQPWAVDVNGDGIADIALGTDDGTFGGVYVFLGHPDGTFAQTPQRFISNSGGGAPIVPGDFNRDGMIDFAQPVPSDGETEFFLNATNRAPCASGLVSPTVTVCQPVDNTYTPSPVQVQANAYSQTPVVALQEYVDNNLITSQSVTSFSLTLPEALGPHLLVTKAWDANDYNFRSNRTITVYSGTPGATCSAALGTASLCLPAGARSGSPVHILGNGYTTAVPTAAQLYIDGALVVNDAACTSYCPGGSSSIDTYQTLATGPHDLVFKLWDANGNTYVAQQTVTIQ